MKKTSLAIACSLLAIGLGGCGTSTSDMTQAEIDAMKNPPKTISPEAAKGMAGMGEAIRKQAEANKAAGVDSRGIPIAKSDGASATPPPGAAGGQ